MKIGDTVLILPSIALLKMQLGSLAGLHGTIVEIRENKDGIKGCWVEFLEPYIGEKEWFIPFDSIGQ